MPIPISTRTLPPGGGGPVVDIRYAGFTIELQRDGFATIPLATAQDSPMSALVGAQGLDLARAEVFSVPIPEGNGDVFLGSRLGTRELFLPVAVDGKSYRGTRDLMRALWAMVGDMQPFDVVVAQPEGDRRRVTVRYVSGLEGSYGDSEWWVSRRRVGLTLLALDPLAYGDEVSRTWFVESGAARPFLSDSEDFFPVVLGSSLVGGVRRVLNAGELDASPVTVVTGPGSGLILENQTTGESFELTGSITQPLTIDTRRGMADVYDDSGDLWDRVVLGSSLFKLVPGFNDISVTLIGADEDSSVSMSWRPPYRSLH